jgi:elongation factor G
MLYYTGLTHRVGGPENPILMLYFPLKDVDVDAGDTVMDYLDLERERGITINAAAITMPWRKHTINLIDTPVLLQTRTPSQRASYFAV